MSDNTVTVKLELDTSDIEVLGLVKRKDVQAMIDAAIARYAKAGGPSVNRVGHIGGVRCVV